MKNRCLILALLLALLPVSGAVAQDWWPFGKRKTEVRVNNTPLDRDTQISPGYAPVVKAVAPSVVTVKTKRNLRPGERTRDDFSGGDYDDAPSRYGLGSGVIVTADGYILTNNHVVEGQDKIVVDLPGDDGREYEAKVVGTDPKSDLAVLKINAQNLPAATLGDSDQLEVGDVVLAVGNPFGIGATVTMGIVSGLGRNNARILGLGRDSYENFIQTDAAINPGNSGGALADTAGRVIGINTAIVSRSQGNLGIGFAIPVNMARVIMEQLIADGKVVRGFLGIQIDNLDPDLAASYGRQPGQGIIVNKVEPGSPAQKAGLWRGDIIVEVNDRPAVNAQALRLAVSFLPPGAPLKIKYLRDNKENTVTVTLGKLTDAAPADEQPDAVPAGDTVAVRSLEFELQTVTPDLRDRLGLPENVVGAVIVKIDPNAAAADKGLRRGTVILEANDKPVTGAKEAAEAIRQGPPVARLYVRDGNVTRYVAVKKKAD